MLQYTREQLLECRQAAPAAIPHRTRKVLFTFRLWRPRSVSVHAHLSRRNSGVTKVKVNTQKQQSRLHARQLRLATLNAFSVRNKSAPLSVALTDNHLDVFMLTESWHKQQDDLAVRMVAHLATRVSTLRAPTVLLVGGSSAAAVSSCYTRKALPPSDSRSVLHRQPLNCSVLK